MATFYCSACNFSKPVKDEMAGKKARCPKCNEVNVVPELGSEPDLDIETESAVAEQEPEARVAEPASAAPATTPEVESTPASASKSESSRSSGPGFKLSTGWMMAFGLGLLPFIAGGVLLLLKAVGLAMICFAIGMLVFGGLAAYYSFF